ncbi:MAG: polyketide cyclase [Comamonadaceae bacterium]|nr:MAG: polyketide cyclase [Comamonadaceae bacterium]
MPLDKSLDLEISRLIKAPRALVWKAWSDPDHLKQWWCPKPWTTDVMAFDFRAGGAFHTFLKGPDGGSSDNPGSFLEIVPQERIVFTTLMLEGFRPAAEPWMPITGIFTLKEEAGGTRYTATCMHKDTATKDSHEKMGFYEGWGTCITQLEAYSMGLRG